MSAALPSRVDALRLTGRDAQMVNVTPVAAMTRLGEALADSGGTVDSSLRFTQDAQGRRVISGHASATLRLLCQRCLDAVPTGVDVEFRVAVVADDAEAEALPADMEATLSADGTVSPLALVEDELILALPIVAMHERCEAPAEAPPVATEHSNPFAVLKELKNRQR